MAIAANRQGHRPKYQKRPKPLQVSGVGHGAQACHYDCHLPIALRHADGEVSSVGELTTPSVQGSELPGLLGLHSLEHNRAIWDFQQHKLYFLGPGDYDLSKAMPPGTDVFQLEKAPSGHAVLPCCEFGGSRSSTDGQHTLTLHSRQETASQARGIPPPPRDPPVLPSVSTPDAVPAPPAAPASRL